MARSRQTKETPGNQPSSPLFGPEQLEEEALKKSTGYGTALNSSSTTGAKVRYSSDRPKKSQPDDLSNTTSSEKVVFNHDDAEASFYVPANSSQTKKGRLRFSVFGLSRRRKIFGGGLVGTIVGVIMFGTFFSGPFEFIHIAHLLEQFHFASLQTEQDDRFAKEARLFRYASKGQVENSRLGYVSNKFANRFETKLNSDGLSSSYTKTFGLFDGYAIDQDNEKFKGKSADEIKQIIKAETGADVNIVKAGDIKGSDPTLPKDKLLIDASSMGYLDTLKLNYGLLRSAGYAKISAAMGARYLCTRAACTSMLHPLTRKVADSKRSLEDWWKNRGNADKEGATGEGPTTNEDPDAANNPDADGKAKKVQAEAEGDKNLSEDEISGKLKIGSSAAAVAGVLCIAKGVASDAHALKASQIKVLERIGMEVVGVGNQFESGSDVNLAQASYYNSLLSGIDSSGNNTSWSQSESMLANSGKPDLGVPPTKTLMDVADDSTPFDFLNDAAVVSTILDGVCSTVGQAITFLGGGFEGLIQGAAFQLILSQTSFASDLAHWLAGSAIDPNAVGADFGNEMDFGAALAANSQAMLSGGITLPKQVSDAQQSSLNQIAQEEFNNQSIAYKLFNPYDNQTLASKAIDGIGTSPDQAIAKMGSTFLDLGKVFSSFGSIFSGQAHAATTGYDYPFPTIGFSQSEMADKTYSNPYENACYVTGCSSENVNGITQKSQPITGFLTGTTADGAPADSNGQAYIDKAQKCFGAKISQVPNQSDPAQMQWDVTSDGADMPNPYDDKYPGDCKDTSDPNWTRLRFFITDTEVMNSMGCYVGDSTDTDAIQACSDIGFNSTAAPASSSNGDDSSDGTTTGTTTGTTSPTNGQIVGNIGVSSDTVNCAANTKDLGVVTSQYVGSVRVGSAPLQLRLCQLSSITGRGNNTSGADTSGGAVVNSRVSGAWEALGEAAKAAGVNLDSTSSFRLASSCGGTGTGTSCATPGTSLHQLGIAIDFSSIYSDKGGNGSGSTSSCSPREEDVGNSMWDWLNNNAAQYGFKQYSYEAWHWDALGGPNRCGGDGTK